MLVNLIIHSMDLSPVRDTEYFYKNFTLKCHNQVFHV